MRLVQGFRSVCLSGALVAWLLGCSKIPEGRSAIDAVEVQGAKDIGEGDVEDAMATAASPKFLGLFRGIAYDYEIYDPSVLQRDLARIEHYYHSRGFFEAHARAARILRKSEDHVVVDVVVEEGPPSLNREVRVQGLESLPGPVADAARAAATTTLPGGARFDEDKFKDARTAIERALTDRGYAHAKVTSEAEVDVGTHTVDYVFAATPGRPAKFGPVTIQGLDPDGPGPRPQEIGEEPIRRAIDIRPGEPYSTKAIDAATQALLDLGVFSGVKIEPQLEQGGEEVPLVVSVEPTRLREIRLGGGAEFDELKTDVHALVGWEDHNFLGGMRDFRVDLKPGAVLWPTRLNNIVAPDRVLPEERLRMQLRQPGFLEARTTGFVRPELNTYALLVQPNPDPSGPVVGFVEVKGAAGAERRFGKLFVSLAHNVELEDPFAYKGGLDPALGTIVLSFPQLITNLDLRDNAVHPHEGIYIGNDLQTAGGPFGGTAHDLRIQPEIRTYVPIAPGTTFATRATVGFLFASNYGDSVQNHLAEPITDENRADRERDIEVMYFRGFFSGGPSSNRGYPFRGIAPHGVVPFLNPTTVAQQLATCNSPTDPNCSIPIGGFTLWELSNEMRFHLGGPVAVAAFCDMSDVSPHEADVRLDHLHLACGGGARYDTPVGPIRLDIGYRIQPLQVLGYPNEVAAGMADPVEGIPPRLFGVPIAVSFGIGEAY
jgi:outer membrane translocation and assembly module TamA